ncbi:MAG: DUF1700 domain-containing protein [Candidatus Izemoplasmatales bacterium]
MNKRMFISKLKKELKNYKKIDSEEIIYYYDEMIQDALDEGQNENDFIKSLGSIDSIIGNIIKDGDFIKEVKSANNNSLINIVSTTVRVISLLCYYFALFIIGIIYISIVIAGFSVVAQAGIYLAVDNLDTMGQIALGAVMLVGLGIGLIGLALIKHLLNNTQSIRLYIIRKTKQLFSKQRSQ